MCDNGDGKPAARGGFCWACLKCLKRNGSTVRKKPKHGVRYESPEEMLTEAVLNLSEHKGAKGAFWRYTVAHQRYLRTVHKSIEDSQ